MESYEKLGAFYLGKPYDLAAGKTEDDLLLYDSKDLCTHAVCVGMTGSGKTGLCVSLLEEAAIDGIPALIVDPKGDLSNLLLTFPELRPEDFRPWINEDDAQRKDLTPDEYAAQQAELWRAGLDRWGQGGDRLRRLRGAADFAVYTPGSEAGLPVSILASFAAPSAEVLEDSDLLGDRIATTVSSLLGLLGIDADPIQSREHILLSTILKHHWAEGRNMGLGELIQAVQSPPIDKIGVLDLDSFYPAKERFALAMQINNLLAAPGFQSWMSGEPLDVDRMLYTPEGRPRMAVFSIAHLSDSERMFFVSLLLNETLSWMRSRAGTTSLRALLYMDEIFGYMPPVAEPPSKKPLLTLLKQARAFGVGVVLATQNPVDLDYKGLSNTGTWFIGRLQTERDKMRVLEGLEGASATAGGGFDRKGMGEVLAGLGKRVFLLHNVHEPAPEVFHTRWAMSYLRGPLTREQIKVLTADRGRPSSPAAAPARAPTAAAATTTRPVLPPDLPQSFLPVRARTADVAYRPIALGVARVHFQNRSKTLQHDEDVALAVPLSGGTHVVDWHEGEEVDVHVGDLDSEPESGASFADLPETARDAKAVKAWRKEFSDTLYRSRRCVLFKSPSLKSTSEPGESERDFRIRLAEASREERDRQKAALQKKFEGKIERQKERIRKARQAVERERDQAKTAKLNAALSVGKTLFSAVFGSKKLSATTLSKASSAISGAGRSRQQAQDVDRAIETVEALTAELEELNEELAAAIDELEARLDPQAEELETTALTPRRADIDVQLVALGWAPYGVEGTPLWS